MIFHDFEPVRFKVYCFFLILACFFVFFLSFGAYIFSLVYFFETGLDNINTFFEVVMFAYMIFYIPCLILFAVAPIARAFL